MNSNQNNKTYYDILEVDRNANSGTIRKAYLKKSLKYHPDKNPNNPEEAKAKFIEIGQAYETLNNSTKRRIYDQELRAGRSGFTGHSNNNNNYHSTQNYDTYMDAFDATVSGMSEAELAATIGTVTAFAAIVGSMIGGAAMGGGGGGGGGHHQQQQQRGGQGPAPGQTRSAGRSMLISAGSIAGGMVASEIAKSSVRALHQDSIKRLSYKEDCRIAVERGLPKPEPPETSFFGKQLGDAFKTTMSSVKQNFTGGATAAGPEDTTQNKNNNSEFYESFYNNNNNNNSAGGSPAGSHEQQQQQREPGTNTGTGTGTGTGTTSTLKNMWRMAAAGVKAAQAKELLNNNTNKINNNNNNNNNINIKINNSRDSSVV
eukprot:CAMPEP_0170852332 /NCGR_PEP_ID=MMETSP0734-20130129/11793_1 /TAXON_ID=186038 /ORGANISM="Fragilariopsis kerguelensis, Strain L26-C5" /LENGTH=371 /DNA_ID=CAMNT_0011222677 /DNA_START=40 /DNA_END=1156 /DNA_ORIENTATION=+